MLRKHHRRCDEMFIFTFLVRRRDAGRLRSAGMAPDQTSDEETKKYFTCCQMLTNTLTCADILSNKLCVFELFICLFDYFCRHGEIMFDVTS